METSIYLAKLMGPIFLVLGLGVVMNQSYFRGVAREISGSPALFFVTGMISLVIGGIIAILHPVWTGWPIVITLIAWLMILRGVMRAVLPSHAHRVVDRIAANPNVETATGLGLLALGAYLTGMGYWLGPLA